MSIICVVGIPNEVELSSNTENWENMNQDYLSQVIPLLGIYLKEIIRDEGKDSCVRMFILDLYKEHWNKCPTIVEKNHFFKIK